MTKRRGLSAFLIFVGAACSAPLWSTACSSDNPEGASPGDITNPPGPVPDACGHPNPGCPCSDVAAVGDCGKVELKVGSYVSCSMGKTTCDGTKWGECQGDTILARSFSGGGLRFASLGAATACTNNPCDPYCQNFVDTPSGLDAASPLGSSDSGLAIAPGPGSCTCNQPANPAAELANIPNTNSGNPASCSGTTDAGTQTDNCNHDYHCVGGTCQPYPIAGVNPSCTASPDYTLGLGCHDGTSWELQLCNRGFVPSPGSGNLVIAIGSGSPSTLPGACTTGATGASWPTGPAINGASPDKGRCVIDLASTSIGPGQCINVNVATQCTQLDGVTPLNAISSAHSWAVVNPSTAILTGTTPLSECDTCNNYTAFEKSAIPPLLSNAATCGPTTCGTVCGAGSDAGTDAGSACHTYVSGTVYDPGGNIPLPGVAVYQPNAAPLPAFAAGVSCDTCSSLLPTQANLVSSTASDLDGNFNLEVNGTTGIPVVFQTGRWRRKITIGVDTPALTACAVNNITVAADCWAGGADAQHPGKWPATNCKTRLPQTQAEGDIPLTAFVTGSAEPFQCSFAQFMGGSSEISVGSGKRIQLYRSNGEPKLTGAAARTGTAAMVGTPPPKVSGTGWISNDAVGTTQTITALSSLTANGNKQSTANASNTAPYPEVVTGLTSMTASFNGGILTMWGSKGNTNPTNNGNWPIVAAGANTATFNHQNGKLDGNNNTNTFKWAAAGPNGNLTAATYVGGTLTLKNGDTPNTGSFPILTVPTSSSVTITNNVGTADPFNGRNALSWTAIGSPGYVVISGLSGITAGHVGSAITFSNGSINANRGTFTILVVISPTQVGIVNPNAVADATGTLTWNVPAVVTTIPDAQANLWDSQAHLSAFDEVILGCPGGTDDDTETGALGNTGFTNQQGYFYNYLKAGGRLFANHYAPSGLFMPSSMQGHALAAWDHTSTYGDWGNKSLLHGAVRPGATLTTPHQNFKTWLTNQGAYAGGGVATPQAVENEFLIPSATDSFEWLRAANNGGSDDFATYPTGNMSLVYSFDTNSGGITPSLLADGGAGSGCGRTVLSAMHVDITRGANSGGFPNVCNLGGGLSPNEAAFEYLLFMLSSCAIGGAPIAASAPPAPPSPPNLTTATFAREYHAVCPPASKVVWQAFSWKAQIPTGTSIVFQAQTAQDASGAPGTYGVAVNVGTASSSTGSTFFTPATTVDQDLTGATPAQRSEAWLKILMTFNPNGATSPTLTGWNQVYDCLPNE
jgi:hypothetical protein